MNIHEHSHLATEGELAGLLIVSPGLLPLRNIHCNFFSFDFYEYFYESEGRYLKKNNLCSISVESMECI